MNFHENLDVLYSKLKNETNNVTRLSILNDIIELKHHFPEKSHETNVYQDFKIFITHYIQIINLERFGYDEFNFDHIKKKIDYLPLSERIKIISFLKKNLKHEGFIVESDLVEKYHRKTNLQSLLKNASIKSIWKIFFHASSYNLFSLLLTLLGLILISSIALLKSPFNWMAIFEVKVDHYSNFGIVNNALNILSYISGFEGQFVAKPINSGGVIVLIVTKLLYLIIIVNFIIKEIQKKLNID